MDSEFFSLPKPLAHYKAKVGSAQIVPDAWGEFGVVVTLETGHLFRIENFKSRSEAERYAAALNDQQIR